MEQYFLEMRQTMLAHTVVIGRILTESNINFKNKLEWLTGSGTLVRKEGQAGILTAGHVIRDLREGDLVKMTILQSSNRDLMKSDGKVIPTEVNGWIIRGEGMDKGKEDPIEKQLWDPDIVWIAITEKNVKSIEGYTQGIFYNWDKRQETLDQLIGSEEGKYDGMWVCGRIHEISQKLLEMGRGYRIYVHARQVFGNGKVQDPTDEWDRYDYNVDLQESEDMYSIYIGNMMEDEDESVSKLLIDDPHEWGGMSGGGIWLAHMNGRDFREKALPDITLVGVVYAQHGIDQQGQWRVLRGHGIRSLKRILDSAG